MTPEFVKARGLDVFSIQDLNEHDGFIPINGCGGKITEPLGYVIIRVQIPYVPSYNEEQVALVVEDPSSFTRRCPVILGTPTINWAVRSMKESEMQSALEEWQRPRLPMNSYTSGLNSKDRLTPPKCPLIPGKIRFTWTRKLCSREDTLFRPLLHKWYTAGPKKQ